MPFITIGEAIGYAARIRPDAPAVVSNGLVISYRRLVADIEHAARFVASQDLPTGARAGIQLDSSYLHIVLILAMDRLGIASMSFKPGVINHDAKLNCVFSSASRPEGLDTPWVELDPAILPGSLSVAPELSLATPIDDREPSRVTRLIGSSGATGNPKIVPITRDLAIKRIFAHFLNCEGMGTNRFLIGMNPATVAGYGWLMMSLCRGATVVTWRNWTDICGLVEGLKISHMLLSPILLRAIVEQSRRRTHGFQSIRMVTTGGTVFEHAMADKARAVLGPNIWNAYASTEAGSVARGHLSLIEEDPSLVGPVLPFVTVQAVDESDRVLPAGEEGIIRISSMLVASRYDGQSAADRDLLRNGHFYPGDLGSVDIGGRLRIRGRIDELINVDGVKLAPSRIEQRMLGVAGIKDVAVIQLEFDSRPQIFAVVVLEAGHTLEGARQAVVERLGPLSPQRLVAVSALPRGAMDKVMRQELSRQLAAHLKGTS